MIMFPILPPTPVMNNRHPKQFGGNKTKKKKPITTVSTDVNTDQLILSIDHDSQITGGLYYDKTGRNR